MRLRGAQEDTADLIPMLRQQVEAQGLAQASWQVPVFCCDELQQPEATTRGVGGAVPSAVQVAPFDAKSVEMFRLMSGEAAG